MKIVSTRITLTVLAMSDRFASQHTVTGNFDVIPSAFKDPGYLRLEMGVPGRES